MPLYEFSCEKCQNVLEIMQKFSDPQPEKCEACGGKLTKLVSLSSFALKGSGWYASDYKPKPAPAQPATPATATTPANSATPTTNSAPTTPTVAPVATPAPASSPSKKPEK